MGCPNDCSWQHNFRCYECQFVHEEFNALGYTVDENHFRKNYGFRTSLIFVFLMPFDFLAHYFCGARKYYIQVKQFQQLIFVLCFSSLLTNKYLSNSFVASLVHILEYLWLKFVNKAEVILIIERLAFNIYIYNMSSNLQGFIERFYIDYYSTTSMTNSSSLQ